MSDFIKLSFGLSIVVGIILFSALFFEKFVTEEKVKIRITKIEKKISEDGEEYSLIHTKEEIFENRNSYFHNKRNAKELASRLMVYNSYHVKVVGYNLGIKLPFFMEHRNIMKIINTRTIIIN